MSVELAIGQFKPPSQGPYDDINSVECCAQKSLRPTFNPGYKIVIGQNIPDLPRSLQSSVINTACTLS